MSFTLFQHAHVQSLFTENVGKAGYGFESAELVLCMQNLSIGLLHLEIIQKSILLFCGKNV